MYKIMLASECVIFRFKKREEGKSCLPSILFPCGIIMGMY